MAKTKSDTPNLGGRPTKFSESDMKFIRFMARSGLTDKQMAEELEVHEQTIHNWKRIHPEFFEKLKSWKEEADEKVERSLYERATGYTCKEEKALVVGGMIEHAVVEKNYPPDTTAAIFWLKNRKPDEWREKTQVENVNPGMTLEEYIKIQMEKKE